MILIKGMEMPKRCFDCPVYDVSAVFCKALDKWVDDGEIETERYKDCPLIEVPPHGRLIDADAISEDDRQVYGFYNSYDLQQRMTQQRMTQQRMTQRRSEGEDGQVT